MSCTDKATCAAFIHTKGFGTDYYCTLFGAFESVGGGFATTYVKVCGGAVVEHVSSVPTVASSTSMSVIPSQDSSVPAEPAQITLFTNEMASSTLDPTTPSPSVPSVSTCPYLDTECPLSQPNSLDNVCADLVDKCKSRYRVGCRSSTSADILRTRENAVSADDCALDCDRDSLCFGFEWAKGRGSPMPYTCLFFRELAGEQKSDNVVFTKRCPGALTEEVVSSSDSAAISSSTSELLEMPISPSSSSTESYTADTVSSTTTSSSAVASDTSIVSSVETASPTSSLAKSSVASSTAAPTVIPSSSPSPSPPNGQCDAKPFTITPLRIYDTFCGTNCNFAAQFAMTKTATFTECVLYCESRYSNMRRVGALYVGSSGLCTCSYIPVGRNTPRTGVDCAVVRD